MSFFQSSDSSQVPDYSHGLRSPAQPSPETTAGAHTDSDQPSLEATARHILSSRRITRVDQRLLLQLSAEEALSQTAKQLLNQVYGGLQQGLIRVVD